MNITPFLVLVFGGVVKPRYKVDPYTTLYDSECETFVFRRREFYAATFSKIILIRVQA